MYDNVNITFIQLLISQYILHIVSLIAIQWSQWSLTCTVFSLCNDSVCGQYKWIKHQDTSSQYIWIIEIHNRQL